MGDLAAKELKGGDLELSPAFWEMIQERRGRPTVPLREVEESLRRDDDPDEPRPMNES